MVTEGPGKAAEEAWTVGDAIAKAWEANADFVARAGAPVQRWLVERLDPRLGQTVLELGAGPGDTGFEVAQKLGPNGRLISTDVSPNMVEVAKRRAASFDVSNVDFRVIDAQQIELDADSVDGVVHRYGPMLLTDPDASFAEVRRVLKDGGRYVAAVFSAPDRNPWLMSIGMSVMQSGVQPPGGNPMDPGGPLSLTDADSLRGRIAAAGFDDVLIEPVDQVYDFADAEEAWGILSTMAGPIAMAIAGLDTEKREAVKATFTGIVEPYKGKDRLEMPGQSLCILAH